MRAVILGPKHPEKFTGGGEVYAQKLAQAFGEIGIEATYAILTDRPRATELLVLNGGFGSITLLAGAWVNRARVVWVIPHDSLLTFSRNCGLHWRRPFDEVLARLLRRKFQSLARRGAIFIAVSRANGEELRRDFGINPVIIPNGIDMPTGSPKPLESPVFDSLKKLRKQVIFLGGFVARWDTAKNPKFIRSFISSMPPEAGMVLRSSPDGIYAYYARLGLLQLPQHERVVHLPLIPREEMVQLYSQLDFLILPSLYEGFGYVILEAALVGVLPFVTPVGLGQDFLQDPVLEKLVIRIPPFGTESVKEVWHRITSILADLPQQEHIRKQLRTFVTRYSWEGWKMAIQELALQSLGIGKGGSVW